MRPDIVVEDDLELVDDSVALQRHGQLAIDVDRSLGILKGAGKRDADVGVLAFAGAVDDAAHHGHLHLLDAGVVRLPVRHGLGDVVLHLLCQHLEVRRGGAAATGAAGDLRRKAADGERLQNLLGAPNFFGSVAAGGRCQ